MFNWKPYLTVALEASGVPYEIYVNGAFVAIDRSGEPAHESWPINHFLRDGRNELAIVVKPWFDDDGTAIGFKDSARVQLKLQGRPASAQDAVDQPIAQLHFSATGLHTNTALQGSTPAGRLDSNRNFETSDRGDVVVHAAKLAQLSPDGERLLTMELDLPLPFGQPKFMSSDVSKTQYQLTEKEALAAYEELMAAYEVVWDALAARDFHKLMPMFEERSTETDRAFFRPAGTTQKRLQESFEKELADPEQQLAPLRPEDGYWVFEVSPQGRLMRLTWGDRGSAVIRLANRDFGGLITEFPIVFRKQDGRFLIAR